jgi:hypothetical protein
MDPLADRVPPRSLLWAAGAWALLYAIYRGYYALGGSFGTFGEPVSITAWYTINAIAALLLLGTAVLPVVSERLWTRRPWRIGLLAFAWVVAVGCVMHAAIGIATRLLSLTGVITIDYPFFASIDRTAADLQALFLNEPWFLVEGLLWGAIGASALASVRARQRWIATAAAAVVVLAVIGVLSQVGVIGRIVVGSAAPA